MFHHLPSGKSDIALARTLTSTIQDDLASFFFSTKRCEFGDFPASHVADTGGPVTSAGPRSGHAISTPRGLASLPGGGAQLREKLVYHGNNPHKLGYTLR